METGHAGDLDGIRTGAADVGAHGVEEVGQIHNVGLLGSVFDDGVAVRQSGGHHDVHGGTHGDHVQIDVGAVEPAAGSVGQNEAALHHHLGAQSGEALDVLVDGHLGTAEAAQQGTDQVIAGADLVGQLIGSAGGADAGGVDLHGVGIDAADHGTQTLQNPQTQRHVGDLGDVFDAADPVHQKGGGDNGNSGIFRAADLYFTKQRLSAANQILCQCQTLSQKVGEFHLCGNTSHSVPRSAPIHTHSCVRAVRTESA